MLYPLLLRAGFGLALVMAVGLSFSAAPYGRHARQGYGPTLSNALSWLVMELPAAVLPIVYVVTERHLDAVTLVFLAIWEAHYLQRAFVYPWLIRGRGSRVPLLVPFSGAAFNVLNAYLNFRFVPEREVAWLYDPRFLLGVLVFTAGYAINRHADQVLRTLRRPGETGYKIPRGGLYRWISCPNYFGELVEWVGWALLTWSLPGLLFALFTAANLVPRAVAHHRDYRRRFAEYPARRRAVLPFIL